MKQSQHFLQNAENCAQLAERASDDPTHRRYKRMEAAWRALAENRIGWTGKYLLHAQMANRFPRGDYNAHNDPPSDWAQRPDGSPHQSAVGPVARQN